MDFYELTAGIFELKLTLNTGNLHEVIIPIDNEKFVNEENLPLKMKAIIGSEVGSDNEKKELDFIEWSSDFTIGGNAPEKGGAFLVVSERVKTILTKYNLPKHKFYPIQIENKSRSIHDTTYFLFHMVGNGIFGDDFIDYEKCTFQEVTLNEDEERIIVRNYPQGSVKSNDEFKKIKMNESEKIKLGTYEFMGIPDYTVPNDFNFMNKVFHYDYDVLWGAANQIYISEEIKNELENNNTSNGNYFKIKENLIRASEYNQ